MITCPGKCWSRPKSARVFGGSEGELTMCMGTEPPVSPAGSITARKLAGPSRYHFPASVTAVFRLSCFWDIHFRGFLPCLI